MVTSGASIHATGASLKQIHVKDRKAVAFSSLTLNDTEKLSSLQNATMNYSWFTEMMEIMLYWPEVCNRIWSLLSSIPRNTTTFVSKTGQMVKNLVQVNLQIHPIPEKSNIVADNLSRQSKTSFRTKKRGYATSSS